MAGPDFPRPIVDILAKRAAHRCSNPDCGVSTTGSNSIPEKSTTVGEAAHIFGARLGMRRYREEMLDRERASAINGIWLCETCHSLIDKDEIAYPADLLFLWKLRIETSTLEGIGKPGEIVRSKLVSEELQNFNSISHYARQIIIDKPEYWEYLLTAELMQHYMNPIQQKKIEIEEDLYSLSLKILDEKQYLNWLQHKFNEVLNNTQVIRNVLATFQTAWGEPGIAGSSLKINRSCQLYSNTATRFVEIAEDAKFTSCPDEFADLKKVFIEGCLHPLEAFFELPHKFRAMVDSISGAGVYTIDLVISLPDGWSEKMNEALERGKQDHLSRFME